MSQAGVREVSALKPSKCLQSQGECQGDFKHYDLKRHEEKGVKVGDCV